MQDLLSSEMNIMKINLEIGIHVWLLQRRLTAHVIKGNFSGSNVKGGIGSI